MKKHLKKKYLQILNKILIVAAIILLLIFLFGFLDDLLHKLDILVKHTGQQANQIHMLENEVNSLEHANTRLENVVVNQYHQIQELKVSGNTITVDLRPKEVVVPDDLHKEIEVESPSFTPQLIITSLLTGLTMVTGTVGKLLLP